MLILEKFIYPNREGGHQVSKYTEQLNKKLCEESSWQV